MCAYRGEVHSCGQRAERSRWYFPKMTATLSVITHLTMALWPSFRWEMGSVSFILNPGRTVTMTEVMLHGLQRLRHEKWQVFYLAGWVTHCCANSLTVPKSFSCEGTGMSQCGKTTWRVSATAWRERKRDSASPQPPGPPYKSGCCLTSATRGVLSQSQSFQTLAHRHCER